MKRIIYALLAGFLLIGPMACKKDETPAPSLSNSPEALAEHDNKSGGIYKGTFANSSKSGRLKINLQGGKKEINITFGGESRTLTTAALGSWTSGTEIVAAPFASGDWSITLSIAADGSVVTVSDLNLAGVTSVDGALRKELSTAIVKVYEGTYSGDDSGKWNFTVQNDVIKGVYAGGSGSDNFSGGVVGTAITIVTTGSVSASGSFSTDGNSASGSWTGSSSAGSWSGSRTM